MAELSVISLGAGVQSSTLLALAAHDALPDGYDRVEVALFADTGDEPASVYKWLDEVLVPMARRGGIEVRRVSRGSLSEEMLKEDGYRLTAPLWVGDDNEMGLLRRECTRAFKIDPIRSEIRRMLGVKSGKNRSVDVLLGISTDEPERLKPSGLDYIDNRYPLIDLGWSRQDCIDYMVDEGFGEPPRSSCVYCPYRSNQEWRELQENDYASFAAAEDFDEAVRTRLVEGQRVYVHRSRRPLATIDFRYEDNESLMSSECSGFCGV